MDGDPVVFRNSAGNPNSDPPQMKNPPRWRRFRALAVTLGLVTVLVAAFIWPFRWTSAGFRLFGLPKARGTPLTQTERALVGIWEWRAGNGHSTLTLLDDGTLLGKHGGGRGAVKWRGSWRRTGDRLFLSTESFDSLIDSWMALSNGVLGWMDEYEVVAWDKCLLLVPSDDMSDFIDDVNVQRERGQGERMRYSRAGSPTTPLPGLPDLPEPWKSRLVGVRVHGEIREVLEKKVVAACGTRDGARVGLRMFLPGGKDESWVHLRILTASETECTLEITSNSSGLPVLVGAEITSRSVEVLPGSSGR
ncbi:MAG: hypothetical protein FD180_4507 [Planctomycetota bacterium]|nr:MAG: hypothetical protein FD180_4507 [Planctomycetota bacterium]